MFLTRLLKPTVTASAHCDLPCASMTRAGTHRGGVLLQDHREYNASTDDQFKARAIIIKEKQAELAKHHIDVLWSDYFKPEHVQKYPRSPSSAGRREAVLEGQGLRRPRRGQDPSRHDRQDRDVWTKAGGPQATRVQKAAAARA